MYKTVNIYLTADNVTGRIDFVINAWRKDNTLTDPKLIYHGKALMDSILFSFPTSLIPLITIPYEYFIRVNETQQTIYVNYALLKRTAIPFNVYLIHTLVELSGSNNLQPILAHKFIRHLEPHEISIITIRESLEDWFAGSVVREINEQYTINTQ